ESPSIGSSMALAGATRYPVARVPVSPAEALRSEFEIDLGPAVVEVAIEDNLVSDSALILDLFNTADSDQNGYVDESEMMKTALAVIRRFFRRAAREGEGKLLKKELEAYNRQQADAIASRIVLTYADRGQTLFAILDRNGDQKLGLRELRRAGERLE